MNLPLPPGISTAATESAAHSKSKIWLSSAMAVVLVAGAWSAWSGSAPAVADEADDGELYFQYGVDNVSWYWSHQIDQEFELGDLHQPIQWPNPQAESTMPVAVQVGDPVKVAALRFDLVERGVPEGASINEFILTVSEGDDDDDMRNINLTDPQIQACAAVDAWTTGEAEMWDVRPPTEDDCVEGERTDPEDEDTDEAEEDEAEFEAFEEFEEFEGAMPQWTFDLSEIASDWGEDPFENHGIVFMPVEEELSVLDNWQANLKLPLREDSDTDDDEYELTQGRLQADIDFDAPPEEDAADESDAGSPPSGDAGGSGGGGGDSAGSDSGSEESEEASEEDTEPAAAAEPFEPAMPWYVWLLIPLALVAAIFVNSAMGSPAGAANNGGVIDRIRSHNAAKRGWTLPTPSGVFQRLTGRGGQG